MCFPIRSKAVDLEVLCDVHLAADLQSEEKDEEERKRNQA